MHFNFLVLKTKVKTFSKIHLNTLILIAESSMKLKAGKRRQTDMANECL